MLLSARKTTTKSVTLCLQAMTSTAAELTLRPQEFYKVYDIDVMTGMEVRLFFSYPTICQNGGDFIFDSLISSCRYSC